MNPPRWVDEDGRLCPTRPCPVCGRVSRQTLAIFTHGTVRRRPYEVLSVVEWCGHLQELILLPDGAEWFREIPVPIRRSSRKSRRRASGLP
jgi:hypothetical protein